MNFKKFLFALLMFVTMVPAFCDSVGFKSNLSEKRQKVVITALNQGGKKYVWGSNDPSNGGFDCSGLVQYVYKAGAGLDLPRTAADIYKVSKKISPEEREPGDLMFFMSGGKISHVGIYCGKYTNHKDPNSRLNGKYVFVNAMSEGEHKGVKIADIEAKYWKTHFYCYARVLPPSKK